MICEPFLVMTCMSDCLGLVTIGHVVRRQDAGEPDAGERGEHEGDRQDDGDVEEVDDAVERIAVAIGAVDAAAAHVAQPPAAARLTVERRARVWWRLDGRAHGRHEMISVGSSPESAPPPATGANGTAVAGVAPLRHRPRLRRRQS